jgi:hypothetical protein
VKEKQPKEEINILSKRKIAVLTSILAAVLLSTGSFLLFGGNSKENAEEGGISVGCHAFFPSSERLSKSATDIIIGKVTKIYEPYDYEIIMLSGNKRFEIMVKADIEVDKTIKGSIPEKNTVTIQYSQGNKSGGNKFKYIEVKDLLQGERAIFFLIPFPIPEGGSYQLTTPNQGRITISKDAKDETFDEDATISIDREFFPMFDKKEKVSDIIDELKAYNIMHSPNSLHH